MSCFTTKLNPDEKTAKPIVTEILTMFEPKTFPTESAAPPEKTAIKATVNSGSDVEKAIRLKPIDVLLIRLIVDTFTALLMETLLA